MSRDSVLLSFNLICELNMAHLKGQFRDHGELIPVMPDELASRDNPVRVTDAFVDQLDLGTPGFSRIVCKEMGLMSYAAGDILELYIYGYSDQMRSSRRREREAARNVELHWRLERLKPSFETIADFRRAGHGRFRVIQERSRNPIEIKAS